MEESIPVKKPQQRKFAYSILTLLIVSLALNIFLLVDLSNEKDANFKFIDPSVTISIDSNVQNSKSVLHYTGLREVLESRIGSYTTVDNVGVFVQDIDTGAWLGMNERMGFAPASLLKVPVMMAILKKVSYNEISLEDKVTIVQEDIDIGWGELYEDKVGTEVTVMQLIKDMTAGSDNSAKNALKRQLSDRELDEVFTHVGIPNPYHADQNNQTVSPRNYNRFFKALYHATFLPADLSELALDIAADTSEESLISKGVPTQIQVSHKFGVYEGRILHDCGIVYHLQNPYFICIMTKNVEIAPGSELIQGLSKDVFTFVDERD